MIKNLILTPLKLSSKLHFSTAASHAPPIKLFGINGRYATALYVSASKANMLSKVDEELTALSEVLKKSKTFSAFLLNPTVPREEKASKLSSLLEEGKVSYPTRNFFLTLAANGRISEVNNIIREFDDLIQASKGVVRVTVFTAEELKKKHIETLEIAIKSFIGKDKTVDMKIQIKEDILGGLQVMVGDKFIDLSVSSRITELSSYLQTADL